MCRAFPITLKGLAREWFSKLPPNTITLFKELSKWFVNNLFRGHRQKRSSSSLLNIEQGENNSSCTFIRRFNRKALLVDKMDNKILLAAFYNKVSSNLFIYKLYDQDPQMMAELIHSAQFFMNAKGAIIVKKKKKGERLENGYIHHSEQGPHPKKAKVGEKKDHSRQ